MANYVTYGPNENCTLALCDPSESIYGYRPSLGANTTFLVLFGIAMILQIIQGVRWRTWPYMITMVCGSIVEILGYGGRIMLWQNPFTFPGFLLQIICITIGPAFYSAAIYLTLSKIILYLGREHSRFSPGLYYWIFIPCDILSLTLQAAGGGLSSSTSGSNQAGVNVAIAGLAFQVFTLTIFSLLALEYAFRYLRAQRVTPRETPLPRPFKIFVVFLTLAIVCILIRCCYRIDELSDGYNGPLISNQGLFIALEGSMIIVAAFALNVAHPGPVFGKDQVLNTPIQAEEKGITA
ncbi:MAG: hypothetical protein M1838_005634 [Thelocarpon superellum]|nr:MAG: hypothetical protein M1838_005634 [Thelocarpon superellum]